MADNVEEQGLVGIMAMADDGSESSAKLVGIKGGGGRYVPKLKDATPYDQVVSGLQKMVRRGLEREALVLGQALFENNFGSALARRLQSIAVEDIGLANPALVAHVFSITAGWLIAKKEGKFVEYLALAMCIILLCRSPKNREVDDAIVVRCEKMKQGELTGATVIAAHADVCIDSHTDEGKAKLRGLAKVNGTTYAEEAWKTFYSKGALLRPFVEVEGNPYGREAAVLKGFDYERYQQGYVPKELQPEPGPLPPKK